MSNLSEIIGSVCDYAFENGFHEVGFSPSKEVDKLEAELSQLRQLCREMYESLQPFAKFACSESGLCSCNNCKARDAIEKYNSVVSK